MSPLYILFFQMTVTILIGFTLRKTRIIDERSQSVLSDILLKAVLPFTILGSSQYEYSMEFVRAIIAVAVASITYYTVGLFAVRSLSKKMKMEDDEKRIFTCTSIFANTGFIGFPLMQGLFGQSGLLLAAVYNLAYNLFFYTYGAHLISKKRGDIREIFFNPVTIVSIAAIVLFVVPWRMPVFLLDTIKLVGNMTVPMSMMILGSALAIIDVKKLFTDWKSFLSVFLRLVFFPTLMLIIVYLVRLKFDMLPVTATTLVLVTGLPSGTLSVIFSERFNCAPRFCARTVFLSLVMIVITIPIFMGICTKVFGI